MTVKGITGINGFGRVGLHLIRYWLDRHREAGFRIDFINDDTLSLDQAFEIITTDRHVRFDRYAVKRADDALVFLEGDGSEHRIAYTHVPSSEIPWIGEPDVLLECSGKHTAAPSCDMYLTGRTRLVLISATSWDADKTLVYGFNHEQYDPEVHRKISYGSCTVNGYVPLAQYFHEQYGVLDSDVHVVHNVPEYKLPGHQTLERRFCTLERSAPLLLPFVNADNFAVIYTVVPYTGVSMIDFRFRVERVPEREALSAQLDEATTGGPLAGLYGIEEADVGPEVHKGTPFSAVLIRRGFKILGDSVLLQGYFDTENSVNRYYDLTNHVMGRLLG